MFKKFFGYWKQKEKLPPKKEPVFSSSFIKDMYYLDGGLRARILATMKKEEADKIYEEINQIYIDLVPPIS